MDDILINYGSEIKGLGNNKIGGLLVRYTDASTPDLAGDYFDEKTDFGFEDSINTPVYLNHRLPMKTANGKEVVVKKKIGEGKLTKSEEGIVIEAILFSRKQYEKALAMLGWSSGTASHLTDRTKTGKAFHIDTWPLGLDASLTPEPCDPHNVCTLKSYTAAQVNIEIDEDEGGDVLATSTLPPAKSLASRLSRLIDDLVDEGRNRTAIVKSLAREALCDEGDVENVLDGTTKRPSDAHLKAYARVLKVSPDQLKEIAGAPTAKTIKGMFAETVAEQTPSFWQLNDVFRNLIRKIALIAKASAATDTDFDEKEKVVEVVTEYGAAITPMILTQITEYKESSEEEFYLKSVTDLRDVFDHVQSVDLDDHSKLAVSALKGIVGRFRANHEARKSQKAGRVLSQRNRERLVNMLEQIKTAVSDCQELLDSSQPMATDTEKRAAQTAFLRLQQRTNKLGAATNGKETTGAFNGNSHQV